MKKIWQFFSYMLVVAGLVGTGTSCKKSWDTPDLGCTDPGVVPNASISDILALSPSGDIVQIDDDLIFEGYVISSDESGNFYMALVLQDAPANPTAGIYVALEKRNAYIDFPPGKKVYVKAKGLFVGKDRGLYKLGVTYDSGYGTRIGRIPPSEVAWRIIPACDEPVDITPLDVDIPEIRTNGDQYLNMLIRLNDVQFAKSELCSTYSLQGVNGEDKELEDCNGNTLIMRTSGYADFATKVVPSGKGSVTAVLGKYRSTYQIYVRDESDVNLDGPRCDGSNPSCDADALTPNATVADLKAFLGNDQLKEITQDWVLEVTVTASDKSGNLYRTVYVADETGGIRVGIHMTDLYLRGYHRGAKLRIKARGLYIGRRSSGEIQLGDEFNNRIGNIGDDIDQDHIFFLRENGAVEPVETTVAALDPSMIGSLIRVDDVRFADPEVFEYFAVSADHARDGRPKWSVRTLESCDGTAATKVFTSGYADFAPAHVRPGTGSLTGILTCYDADHDGNITSDELQIVMRDIYDVDMQGDRCGAPLLLETFGLTVPGEEIDLRGWYNYAEAGTRKWTGAYYDGSNNHYAQMSAYRTNEDQNIAWLVSPPVSVRGGMTLTFQTAQAYWRHDALEVLISTDFNGFDVRRATWTPLPARIATGTDPRHEWIDSGEIDLSPYAGQVVFIAFRYRGSGNYGQTTTYRIDNVVI
ncbi:MAG: DUF5017 domain-containing protein, partial [Chlorobi bacterium]|nr:DUF5017 domain-containing protein [Chlorobiota bacterium]